MSVSTSVSTKDRIIAYLRLRGQVSGSELEKQAEVWGTKSSVISRRARELAHEGKIDRILSEKKTVQYKVKTYENTPTVFSPQQERLI